LIHVVLFRSERLNETEIRQHLLRNIPVESDFESDLESEFEDNDNDEDFLARRRERGDDADAEEVADLEDEELPDLDLPGDDDDDDDAAGVDAGGEPVTKKKKEAKKIWIWTDGDLEEKQFPESTVKSKGMEECHYPVDFFLELLGSKNLELLVEQSNIQRVAQKKKLAPITETDMRQFIGILMYMSVVTLPNTRLFWRKSMNISAVFQVMTRNRFEEIKSVVHLSNNAVQPAKDEPGYDKLFKVRQLLTNLNKSFMEHAEVEEVTSVDEQMIPYKGTFMLKVYMKNKPSKWGIKVGKFYFFRKKE
jgi:hypothetical protein